MKQVSYSDLRNKINSQSTLINADELFNDEFGFVHTGNYAFNALLSASVRGGYKESTLISLNGENSTGKTYLALNAVKHYQKQGYMVKFYDSEGAVNKALAQSFGISMDPDKWDYKLISTVEEFRIDATNTCQELINYKRDGYAVPKLLLVLDSAGNLASSKEVEDAISGSNKADMTRAKILKSVFRILTTKLAELSSTLLFTNHIYKTTDFISQDVASGGTGPSYAASIIIFLSKAQLKEGQEKTGIIVTATTKKNRIAKPNKIKFHIHYDKGMNPYIGLHEYISWENCGIENGKIITASQFETAKKKSKGDSLSEIEATKYSLGDKEYYFVKAAELKKLSLTGSSKFAVKHLASEVSATELFRSNVFTDEVLELLDNNVISKLFKYGDGEDIYEEVFKEEVGTNSKKS